MQSSYLPSHPVTYSQLIKNSLKLYRDGFKGAMIVSLLLSFVIFLPRIVAIITGKEYFNNASLYDPTRLLLLLVNVIGLVFFIAIFWHYFCVARGKHEPLAEDFSKGIHKVARVFVAGIIQAVIVFSCIILILGLQFFLFNYQILFGNNVGNLIFTICFLSLTSFLTFYVCALFIFQAPLIVIENKGIFRALERSVQLVWNHWLRTVAVQVTPWLVYILILMIFEKLFQIKFHYFFIREENATTIGTIIQFILFTLLMPWVASLLLLQMKDLELRNKITK